MGQLLDIDEVSRQTGLEESLIRFYESEYPEALPEKVLKGGALFFDSGCVEIFKKLHVRYQRSDQEERKRYGRVIAVTSGKGGVGKSNITLNIGLELQRLGKMCVVLDGDMGLANLHLLAGIDTDYNLGDVLTGIAAIDQLITAGPEGIGVISGGDGLLNLADSSRADRARLISSLAVVEEEADIILVDTGAGMGAGVRDFLRAADEVIFVLTQDITSLADAYALLKAVVQEGSVPAKLYSIVNMTLTVKQAAEIAVRFSRCAEEFLGLQVESIGYVLRDSMVTRAVAARTPYVVLNPKARISGNTRNIAAHLIKQELPGSVKTSAFARFKAMVDKKVGLE
ncbi:MAG: AAA family ATPase [Thermodesulfobacteriota bacterium]